MFPSPTLPDVSEERICVYSAWQQLNAGVITPEEFADIVERPHVFTNGFHARINALLAQCDDTEDEE